MFVYMVILPFFFFAFMNYVSQLHGVLHICDYFEKVLLPNYTERKILLRFFVIIIINSQSAAVASAALSRSYGNDPRTKMFCYKK